ncbi:RNA polymerase sigma-70 factor [Pseudoflavitalea sp. G-6-1-2]|uniref:RNA polymerase sigma factor n=1 Tax=Pseudoflavitalea sp. G-6-1-2 TaxID=2728841 RepID=UPI00146E3FA4|nr:RNA polymerase sigma-70 factor [Pseudoflavitalea sp. G-6-1-2]NML22092.1 RNA polymerase sigma-70 factor [Pseudoflavitalea sp. G-6-1-2]
MENLLNEQVILNRVAADDRDAFRQVYNHYYGAVQQYVLLFSFDSSKLDELTQDVFVRIWEKRHKLTNVESFQNYLFKITKNQVLNYIRGCRVQQRIKEAQQLTDEPFTEDTDHKLVLNQYYQMAAEAIEQLPAGRKQVLKMSIDEGLTLDEIAEKLGISKSGVKNQLYAGIAHVRQYLERNAGITTLLYVFLSLLDQ